MVVHLLSDGPGLDWFNHRVREAARNQTLSQLFLNGDATFNHKWTVTVAALEDQIFDFGVNPLDGKPFFSASVFKQPGSSNAGRVYQVNVGTGCVNDQPATIEYLAKADPRGWQMPSPYPPYAYLQKLYGKTYPFVDRPMWESPAPCLYLTAPDAQAVNLGGFTKVLDVHRPQYFRTADAWERDLYQASVMVTLTPFKADPAAVNLAVNGPRTIRWRVQVGQVPPNVESGVSGVATQELARIYLLRTPGHPEQDNVYVQQLVFWDLFAMSLIDLPLLELIGVSTEVLAAFDVGLLALGVAGGGAGLALGTAMVGVSAGVVGLIAANLQQIVEATSGVAFWN